MSDAGLFGKSDDGYSYDAAVNDLKALANQGVFPDDIYQNKEGEENKSNSDKKLNEHDTQVQTKSTGSGPPSPGYTTKSSPLSPSATTSGVSPNITGSSAAVVGRKRRSRDEVTDDITGESSGVRKSLRGAGVKSTRGKRPKVVVANN